MAICWERAVPLAFHLCCFYFSAALIVGIPFPFGVEFDWIGSWSLPFICFKHHVIHISCYQLFQLRPNLKQRQFLKGCVTRWGGIWKKKKERRTEEMGRSLVQHRTWNQFPNKIETMFLSIFWSNWTRKTPSINEWTDLNVGDSVSGRKIGTVTTSFVCPWSLSRLKDFGEMK